MLHHPQPLSFGPLLHPTPILPTPQLPSQATNLTGTVKFEQNKLTSSFEFSSLNSNFYKPLNQLQQLSPTNSKSTISIDSSSVSSNSERIVSPHSTVDSHNGNNVSPPPIIDVTSTNIIAPVATSSSSSTSSSLTAIQSNGILNTDITSLTIPNAEPTLRSHNGLLDILMNSDKCQVIFILLPQSFAQFWSNILWKQEFIQYHQAHNSIFFPTLHNANYQIDGLTNPRLPTWEFLQETTARLLFMAIRWIRCLMPFQTLSKTDQQLLLQESWKELFLLNFAQWSVPWDLGTLFDSPQVRERIPDDMIGVKNLFNWKGKICYSFVWFQSIEMKTIQEILCRFRQLSPDSSECGCMKAIILFSPGIIIAWKIYWFGLNL